MPQMVEVFSGLLYGRHVKYPVLVGVYSVEICGFFFSFLSMFI